MNYTTGYAMGAIPPWSRASHSIREYRVKHKIITGKLSKTLTPISKVGLTLCSLFSTVLTAIPAFSAEQIIFSKKPFGEFYIPVHSLEVFAKQGKIDDEFAFYASRATPNQLAQLRNLLKSRFDVTPTLVSQFTYSSTGETVVRRLGEILLTDSGKNGFYALRAAFILSAAEPDGLTVLNVLRRFPGHSIRFDLHRGLEIVGNLSELQKRKDTLVAAIQLEASVESTQNPFFFFRKPDLLQTGSFNWHKETLNLIDESRVRRFLVDLYLPQLRKLSITQKAAPVVVISHGLAEDRNTFAYLAQHLASYGFAVAVIEHPGIDKQRFQQYFTGRANSPEPMELINQPLDVKYLLDELQRRSQFDPILQGRLNLHSVGVIGHSLGGYTALVLAGAKINQEQLRSDCYPNNSLNMSLLVQCDTRELSTANYSLQDHRIQAVIAINPLTSSIFGQSGLSQIQVPSMLIAATDDIVTPASSEQIRPFTWLTTSEKYLVLMEKATHFSLSTADSEPGVLPIPASMIGPDPAIARSYLNALSVAFFQTHIAHRPEYGYYLNASYAKFLSQDPLKLSFVKSLTIAQSEQTSHSLTAHQAQKVP